MNNNNNNNNAIRTNHIKARIDKTQQNSKCRLCSDRDETINHIISECSKLAQKEVQGETRLGGQGDPLGNMQEISNYNKPLEKRKHTNIWASWRLTLSNKWRWKKKFRKNISGELKSYSRQNYRAETLSNE